MKNAYWNKHAYTCCWDFKRVDLATFNAAVLSVLYHYQLEQEIVLYSLLGHRFRDKREHTHDCVRIYRLC